MPNYADPFGRAGAAAGGATGAAGGSFLGSLGRILEPLDYPRQALWNLGRSGARALSGEGTWDDALRAVPGALGTAAAGGLIASGVGAPLGIALGSAVGGLAQGAGKVADEEKFAAPEVSDVTGTDDFTTNLLVGMAGDPLTYAGGLGGAVKGASAGKTVGQKVGKGLEEAAAWRGPKYPGGAEKLTGIFDTPAVQSMGDDRLLALREHVEHAMQNPGVLTEIAHGSTYLGHGSESVALRHPEGGVTLIRRTPEVFEDANPFLSSSAGSVPPTRVNAPEMLPAVRSVPLPGAAPTRVEHVPFAQAPNLQPPTLGLGLPEITPSQFQGRLQRMREMQGEIGGLQRSLAERGMDFWDPSLGNVGTDAAGKLRVIDPGAVYGASMVPEMAGKKPGMIQNALLRLLGSDKAVQRELSEQLARANAGTQSVAVSPLGSPALRR